MYEKTRGEQLLPAGQSVEKVAQPLFRQRHSPPRAGFVRYKRTNPTLAGCKVFSPTHMSPEKMDFIFLRHSAQTLRGFFEKLTRREQLLPAGV